MIFTYSSPGVGYYSDAAEASAVGSFAVTANSITANGSDSFSVTQSGNGGLALAEASASTVFQAGFEVTTPTYYSLSFTGPAQLTVGSTGISGTFHFDDGPDITEPYSDSGVLTPGYYSLLAEASGSSSTCAGCIASGNADFSLSLDFSSTPIATPLPATGWLLLSGIGGLGLMRGRRRGCGA
jgi:hypothetical protein